MDLTKFAAEVGPPEAGAVTIAGLSTRGGAVSGVRRVCAPSGIDWLQADEMTVACGAATPVAELAAALAEVGQGVALPAADTGSGAVGGGPVGGGPVSDGPVRDGSVRGGTVGGALAVGRSGIRRLGDGPVRNVLLQADYVSAAGDVITAGGPTVKNVSGFDICRLLVGSIGTLGFIGAVILRTRPLAATSRWFTTARDPWVTLAALYRPVSVLWDGTTTWVLLEGHATDVAEQAVAADLIPAGGPPPIPAVQRWSVPPRTLHQLVGGHGFVAEIGVGVVHHADAKATPLAPRLPTDAPTATLHRRIKVAFDPTARLNPGIDPLRV